MSRITDKPTYLPEELTRLHRRVLLLEKRLPYLGAAEAPAGGGAETREYSFASPLLTWVITHDLASSAVEVNCFDLTGTQQYDPEVEITDANTVTVRWYYPTAGIARLIG